MSEVQELCLSSDDEVAVAKAGVPESGSSRPSPEAKAVSSRAAASRERPTRPAEHPLPYGWVRKQSKSKKGAVYYANILTGKTQVERPGAPRSERKSQPVRERKERRKETEEEAQKRLEEEERRRKQAEEEAKIAEAELEEVKRKAAERRAARDKALTEEAQHEERGDDEDEDEEEDSKIDGEVSKDEFERWKQEEELREEREAKRARTDENAAEVAVPKVVEPCLDVIKDEVFVERHVLGAAKQRWTIGRSQDQVDFCCSHTSISRVHCALERGGARIFVIDLNSGHGVFVNGSRIEKNGHVQLKHGMAIRFGASSRTYIYHEP